MKIIPTNIPQGFLIDSEDFPLVRGRSFILAGRGYVCITVRRPEKTPTYIHRLIMKAPGGVQVDHINGDKLDNRKSNLRFANNSQNNANRPKISGQRSSKYKGVYFCKKRKVFYAEITVDRKKRSLGSFEKEIDAAKAYDCAAKKSFKEYASLNLGGSLGLPPTF